MTYNISSMQNTVMKKLFTWIAATSLLAGCAENVATSGLDGDGRHISFGVTESAVVSVKVEDTATRSAASSLWTDGRTPWTAEMSVLRQMVGAEAVVKAETDFPGSEELCLTITDEPCIGQKSVIRGSLQNMVDTRTLVFGVTEFVKDDTSSPVFSNRVPMVQNTTVDDGLELYMAQETWEDDAYNGTEYDFYAYAPHVENSGDQGVTLSNNHRTITYNPAGIDVGDQPDLMTARKATYAYIGLVPLTFQHRLCAIQIKTAGTWAAGYHVSGVKFTNVISSGTFDIDTDKDATWTSYGTVGNYEVSGFNEAATTAKVVTGPDDKWLMMVPQTLSSAKISITLTDDDTETHSYTVVAPISAYTWTAGHTVTYTISPASITSVTVNYPTGWNDGSNPVDGPVTTYETADQFGLFVLDRDNKILVSNEPVSPTAGDAAASRTLDIPATIFKSKQYKYFLMYPYRSDLATIVNKTVATTYDDYYKVGATVTGRTTDANTFFEDVITNWSPAADQSAAADFKKQDLQIAVLSGSQFDMVHKMGLVEIQLGTKTVPAIRTYSSEAASGPDPITGMKYTDSGESQEVTASNQFDDSCLPLNRSGYFYIVNGSKTLKSVSTVNTDWEYELTGIVAGSYNAITIENTAIKRTCYKFTAVFAYTGSVQPFPLPVKGSMTMQCWGAEGGGFIPGLAPTWSGKGGYGGYAKGEIALSKEIVCYVYVGGRPVDHNAPNWQYGGWNGGGDQYGGGAGGGATDVRFVSCSTASLWNELPSLRSRIIVAGGGGGWDTYATGGYGGGLLGGNGTGDANCGTGGTQTSGGTGSTSGSFGQGGQNINFDGGGAGGGWYGGGQGNSNISSGGGGSGFISGHPFCNGVNSSGAHLGASVPSQIRFPGTESDVTVSFKSGTTVLIDGGGCQWTTSTRGSLITMPNPLGGNYASGIGHSGNGYAKITMITPDND